MQNPYPLNQQQKHSIKMHAAQKPESFVRGKQQCTVTTETMKASRPKQMPLSLENGLSTVFCEEKWKNVQ